MRVFGVMQLCNSALKHGQITVDASRCTSLIYAVVCEFHSSQL